jgi:ABC-type transport system involved in multi-copper enzyme maturation permease subunit
MRFILGLLLGYYIRGKKRLLMITLTVYIGLIIICSVVVPAILMLSAKLICECRR